MQLLIVLLLAIIVIGIFGYMTYRANEEKRVKEKKRNIFRDRV